MNPESGSLDYDREAAALAACYRLLLQKARERRKNRGSQIDNFPCSDCDDSMSEPTDNAKLPK